MRRKIITDYDDLKFRGEMLNRCPACGSEKDWFKKDLDAGKYGVVIYKCGCSYNVVLVINKYELGTVIVHCPRGHEKAVERGKEIKELKAKLKEIDILTGSKLPENKTLQFEFGYLWAMAKVHEVIYRPKDSISESKEGETDGMDSESSTFTGADCTNGSNLLDSKRHNEEVATEGGGDWPMLCAIHANKHRGSCTLTSKNNCQRCREEK